jgi:pyrroloquinoline quinone (PQQ) biosynthesis protein C
MSEKMKRRFLAGFYGLAVAAMAASLTYELVTPKAHAERMPIPVRALERHATCRTTASTRARAG